jgi:hypothetical protein
MFVYLMVALCRAMLRPSDFPSRTSACPPCGLSSWISASRWCTIGIRPAAVFTCQSVTHDTMCSRWVVLRGIFISYATTKAAVDAFNAANRWRKRGISLVWPLSRGFTYSSGGLGAAGRLSSCGPSSSPPPTPQIPVKYNIDYAGFGHGTAIVRIYVDGTVEVSTGPVCAVGGRAPATCPSLGRGWCFWLPCGLSLYKQAPSALTSMNVSCVCPQAALRSDRVCTQKWRSQLPTSWAFPSRQSTSHRPAATPRHR